MSAVFLVDAVRTPRGKAKAGGGLAAVRPVDLVGTVLTAAVERAGLAGVPVDDVIVGCAAQVDGQGGNIARTAALLAGLGDAVPGLTVNRLCSSGLDAIAAGAGMIASGAADVILAGGVESVSSVPMFADRAPLYTDPDVVERIGAVHMGIAADLVATEEGLRREDLDAYGERTQHRAQEAWRAGRYDRSLVVPEGATITADEHVRGDVTAAALAALPPAFADLGASGQDALALKHIDGLEAIEHLHTRGTSPSLADGAAMTVLASEEAVARYGLSARARVVGSAAAGGDPVRMLLAGQMAIERVLRRAGLAASAIDVVEFAEAFAALCLKLQRNLGLDDDRLNPNGGTIAMGHAFGATGAILATGLIDELERRGGRFGVAAVSGAAGTGAAVLFEHIA